MSEVQVSVQVPAGVKAVGDVVLKIVGDIKLGLSATAIIEDAIPALVSAVGLIGELQADIQDPAVYAYAGVFAGQLLQTLLAAPAVVAAAPSV